ncbi:MAG: sporulation integral membrane protein YtvI [Lachnospiraceae bacterium]|jgi:sporulation integral membrane protein YtvI|nr:sporulation integral membrane protein YtvI [Lachnospiraceae bacterium 10-1]MCX4352054.1 sporulation integral membrane protein YtvI [Lachnospiraceae bacterium]
MDKNENRRTYLKVFINLGIMLVLLLFFIFVAPRIIIYFMPFVVGWSIAMIASPLVGFFEKKVKIKRKAGSAFVIIIVIGLVIFAGYFVSAKLMEQVIEFAGELPDMWEGTQQEFAQIGEKLEAASKYLPDEIEVAIVKITSNVGEYLGELFGRLGSPAIETLSRFTMNLPSILIGIIMCLLSAYFFVADKDYVANLLHKVMTQSMLDQVNMVKRGLIRAVGGYFKAQLKIEFWMYLLLVIGFTILRVKYAFLIAIGVAFLDLLPFFGTGTVLIPWAIVKFLNGEYTMVIGLLIIWGVGQLARQLIQPRIVGDSVGLEPIPTLFLLFIGYKSAGVVGMIIAVPIGIIVLTMYEEGVFDTTIDSMKVLYASVSNFRHLNDEDMKAVQIYRDRKRLKGKNKEALEDESNSL